MSLHKVTTMALLIALSIRAFLNMSPTLAGKS